MNPVMSWQDVPVVLTAEEAADLLKVHPNTLKVLLDAGELPGAKVGRAWRVSRDALRTYIETTRQAEAGALPLGEGVATYELEGIVFQARAELAGDDTEEEDRLIVGVSADGVSFAAECSILATLEDPHTVMTQIDVTLRGEDAGQAYTLLLDMETGTIYVDNTEPGKPIFVHRPGQQGQVERTYRERWAEDYLEAFQDPGDEADEPEA